MKTITLTIFVILFSCPAVQSDIIPYSISGSYYDYHTDETHSVSGSTLIDNDAPHELFLRNLSTGEFNDLYIPTNSGDVEDLIDFSTYEITGGWTHYFFDSFTLTSLDDPNTTWSENSGSFRFEYGTQIWDISTTMLHTPGEYLSFNFNYSDLTLYDRYDQLLWTELAPTITAFGHTGESGHLKWDLTLTNTAPIPEPATILMFGVGIAVILGAKFRQKK